jgi:hypothetical protein
LSGIISDQRAPGRRVTAPRSGDSLLRVSGTIHCSPVTFPADS